MKISTPTEGAIQIVDGVSFAFKPPTHSYQSPKWRSDLAFSVSIRTARGGGEWRYVVYRHESIGKGFGHDFEKAARYSIAAMAEHVEKLRAEVAAFDQARFKMQGDLTNAAIARGVT